MIRNARALQSVAMSAVMAMIGWLLIVENGGGVSAKGSLAYSSAPVAQALIEAPFDPVVHALVIEQALERSVSVDGWTYFSFKTPEHANGFKVHLRPKAGDADLYVREGGLPTGDVNRGGVFDASSALQGLQLEEINFEQSGAREWYIAVHGVQAGSFVLEAKIH